MSGVFGGQLSKLKQKSIAVETATNETAVEVEQPAPAATTVKRRKLGKVSNPDYKIRGVLIHKALQRRAEEKWRTDGHTSEDLADLVEHALKQYVGE